MLPCPQYRLCEVGCGVASYSAVNLKSNHQEAPLSPCTLCQCHCILAASHAQRALTALAAHAPTIRVSRGPNIHLGSRGRIRPRAIYQALLDVRGEGVKGLVDVDVALCRDLEERNAEFVCECLALFCADGALLFPVALVADEDLVDALGGVLLDVGEPCANV